MTAFQNKIKNESDKVRNEKTADDTQIIDVENSSQITIENEQNEISSVFETPDDIDNEEFNIEGASQEFNVDNFSVRFLQLKINPSFN